MFIFLQIHSFYPYLLVFLIPSNLTLISDSFKFKWDHITLLLENPLGHSIILRVNYHNFNLNTEALYELSTAYFSRLSWCLATI